MSISDHVDERPLVLAPNTTGETCFPECQMHLGKAKKTLGEAFPECNTRGRNLFFLKSFSPSATLGEEIYFFKKTLPRVPLLKHSGKIISLYY
jgi:hypothetical protein